MNPAAFVKRGHRGYAPVRAVWMRWGPRFKSENVELLKNIDIKVGPF